MLLELDPTHVRRIDESKYFQKWLHPAFPNDVWNCNPISMDQTDDEGIVWPQ